MVQSPSWEANWFAASQEIPRISRNPKVHYRTHNRPPPVYILGQPNPVHIPTSHLLEIHPNIIHPSMPRSPQWSPSLRTVIKYSVKYPIVFSYVNFQYKVFCSNFVAIHVTPPSIHCSDNPYSFDMLWLYIAFSNSSLFSPLLPAHCLCYKSEGRKFDPSWCHWNF